MAGPHANRRLARDNAGSPAGRGVAAPAVRKKQLVVLSLILAALVGVIFAFQVFG